MRRTPLPPGRADTARRANDWAAAVFALYGRSCYLHALAGHPRIAAHQAAHILKRSRMGAALAYGPKDGPPEPRLGRPLCYTCHQRQETDLDPAYRFPYADVLEATRLHNAYARAALALPAREHFTR